MAHMATPFPSGVSASAATQRRNDRRQKERKDKPSKSRRLSHDEWLVSEMDGIIDNLCLKMFEAKGSGEYATTKEFCGVYADHVIDRRRVRAHVDRVQDLGKVLNHAEEEGRILILDTHYGHRVSIKLSIEEMEAWSKLAQDRQAKKDRRTLERRRSKGHWAVV